MNRGEIWTRSGGRGYAGKVRPAVILQDDNFDGTCLDHHLRLDYSPRSASRRLAA